MYNHLVAQVCTSLNFHSTQSFWVRVSFTLQYFAILPCKNIQTLWNCLVISCVQPFLSHPTDVRFDFELDSGWAFPEPWSSFGEVIPFLIWSRTSGRFHEERWNFSKLYFIYLFIWQKPEGFLPTLTGI